MTINILLTKITDISASLFENGLCTLIVSAIRTTITSLINKVIQLSKDIENRKKAEREARAKDRFMRFRSRRTLKNKPFKEAEEDIKKRMLECGFPIPDKTEDIDIGKYRTFGNLEHPLQYEYDDLSEDVKRELAKEDSLFLSGKLDRKAKLEVLRNADFIGDISQLEKNKKADSRFTDDWPGIGKPVLDKLHGVFYKIGKNPFIKTTATMVRYYLKELGIDNIVLPRREFWVTRDPNIIERLVKACNHMPNDESAKMVPIMLEEMEENILPFNKCENAYRMLDPEMFNDAIVSLTKLFCFIEIGDLDSRNEKTTANVQLIDLFGRYFARTDNPRCESICRFDNLAMKFFEGNEGNLCCKFVLVDIDSVRSPDHTTVETLIRMFPNHIQLIIDTVKETNPDLFDNYSNSLEDRNDVIVHPAQHICSKKEIIDNYKRNKDGSFISDRFWKD